MSAENHGAPGLALQTLSIERVAALHRRFGRRFVDRFFTADERAFCELRRHASQHFAARLAAKLATRRLLGPVALREVEVARDASGAPSIRLLGGAATRGAERRFLLSLSHDGGLAVALVVGEER